MALSTDCISRVGLRALAVTALKAAGTLAGQNVFDPRSIPTSISQLPMLVVSTPAEKKNTAGSGAPQFDTVITLAVMARVAPGSEAAAEMALDQIVEQVQRAILCTPDMIAPVQRFESVESQMMVSADGETFVGEAVVMFGCEVYQLYEPDADEPFLGFEVSVPAAGTGEPVRFSTDLPQ